MKQKKTNRNFVRFGALLALVAMWVVIPFALGDRTASAEEMLRDEVRLGATLTGDAIGGTTPRGSADYRVTDQTLQRLDVEGSSINLPSGTLLTVSINNAVLGQTSVTTCGTFLFRRRTDDGQQVPVITSGMQVQVLNGSTVVLAGTFGSPSPSPTGSPSGSPSPSPSASPCASPSPSPTGSPTGSPSPSPTGSPTGSPSPSPTGSPTGSPSPSPSPTGSPNAGDLFAGLSGPVINGILPNGFAQFEIHSSRLELEVRVNQVNLPAGTQLAVIVDGTNVGSLFISSGEGRLRLRTDNGQTVPAVVVGSTIAIQNGGSNILSGTFAGFTGPSPSPSPTASPSPGGSPSPSPSPSLGRSFESHLNGARMQPPVQTAATGEIKVTLNAAETQATIFGEFHNLGSNQTGARIEALVGDGSVVHDLGVVGGINGNFASVTINVSAAQVSQIRSGLWSAVITSVGNPAGEIRGRFTQRSNLSDFDGDGSNDLAVYRPSQGAWYMLNGSGFTASSFGNPSDKVVSADYDGDGRTDVAVFQNVNGIGTWQIKRSSDGGVTAEQFGFASDLPTRGDFDGDGINDVAVYRPSTGVWYVRKSNNTGYIIVRFGAEEDRPMPLDMDGDGRDDIAVFRPSTGMWYWLRSSDGQSGAVPFGQLGDIPVRGDFDGDGKSDITVFRPSTGIWYTLFSSTGSYRVVQFGTNGDIPVAGNYDGDSKTDIAVFRPSDGVWYILRSIDGGFQAGQFGLNGDLPAIAR